MGDANSPAAHRYHRAVFQGLEMVTDDLGEESDTLLRRDIRQAHQSSGWDLIEIDELAEVSVDGNQNPALRLGEFQQCPVSGILSKGASFKDIMPLVQ